MITNLRTTIWGRLKDLANAKVVQLCAAGVPNAQTGKNIAGKGSLYTDITAGDIYINKGTILVPSWTKANALAALATQTDARNVAATGTTDFYLFAPGDGNLNRALFVAASALPASMTNYVIISITNLGQDGMGNVAMLTGSDANSTKTMAIEANRPRPLELSTDEDKLKFVMNDRIRIRIAVVGTLPNPINGVQFVLN